MSELKPQAGEFDGSIVDPVTNEVLGHFTRPADTMDALYQTAEVEGFVVVPGHLPVDRLYNPDTKRTRKRLAWNVKVNRNTITGLPNGTKALVQGRWADAVEGTLTIAADLPETVRVILQHPQYGETELQVACAPSAAAEGAFALEQDMAMLRADAYPPIGDQLDVLWKGFARISAAVESAIPGTVTPEIVDMIESIAAVKEQFPKSELETEVKA